ncbi:hypothetical protein GCM10009716_10280 [Streptomyces sodiiphilus]|uniref:HTH luxR-type domain-containing protein n=1 Tax=Streptomyces sodiiphilus TaxID=226217 RepID=A0ABN2NUI4_9ACTN
MNTINHPHSIAVLPRTRTPHAPPHPERTGPDRPAAPAAPNGPWSDVLLELSRRLADLASGLDGTPSAGGRPSGPAAPAEAPGVTALPAPADLDAALHQALSGAGQQVLAGLPAGPRDTPEGWDAPRAVRALAARGIPVHLLYRHTTRFDEAAKDYARAVQERIRDAGGAACPVRIRTLPEFFEDMIVVDRSVVFLPFSGPGEPAGLAVTHPVLVRFLADLFERAWGRADTLPYRPTHAAEAAREVMPAVRGTIRRLLTEGWSDAPIARRVGVSTRTLQTHIAAMKEETGAGTRVQLGYLLGLAAARTCHHPDTGPAAPVPGGPAARSL